MVSSISDFYLLNASSSFPVRSAKILTLSNYAREVGVGRGLTPSGEPLDRPLGRFRNSRCSLCRLDVCKAVLLRICKSSASPEL